MSTHKSIDKICIVIVVITLVAAVLFCNGTAFGIETKAYAAGYESRLFDTSRVHTLDIVMDDWDSFIENCAQEEYSACNVVIDGEAFKNVGIRGKGNTSLSTVSSLGSSRYSFKIEFDQYDGTKSYHGLDKLCLNNIIQDNTYMKDYLAYMLMGSFGVDAPLCSYVYITINGEDWGLYLAVEGVEDAFLKRNYGNDHGKLYKPDSLSFGGGRGNGMDFSMSDFMDNRGNTDNPNSDGEKQPSESENVSPNVFDFGGGNAPDFGENLPNLGDIPSDFGGEVPDFGGGNMPSFDGMGSSDVKLQYIDDDPDSYSNIFNNAKTDITDADKSRLISSLKMLSEGGNIEETVNVDEVIRYFVVHNFLCNGDSYTGAMIHNYYLYEEDGQFSMIPWDYNLAFGTFQGSDATSTVNFPIDTPVSGDMSDRPMIAWIFDNEEYTELYHELLEGFVSQTDFASIIDDTAAMISDYVEKDPTKFCTFKEFEKGVETIRKFCLLRAQSISGQLDGSIPSTTDEQNADKTALVDASGISLSDMGTMNSGGGPDKGGFDKGEFDEKTNEGETVSESVTRTALQPLNDALPDKFNGLLPKNFNGEPPADFSGEFPSDFGGNFPDNFGNSSDNSSSENNSGSSSNYESNSDNTSSENNNGRPGNNFGDFGGNRPGGDNNGPNGNSSGNNMPPSMGDFPGTNGATNGGESSNIMLLIVSVGVLAIGLLFAFLFKR